MNNYFRKGFTFVETMVSIVLLLLFLGILGFGLQGYFSAETRLKSQWAGYRGSVELIMGMEIFTSRVLPPPWANPQFASGSTDIVADYCDGIPGNQVSFRIDGTWLKVFIAQGLVSKWPVPEGSKIELIGNFFRPRGIKVTLAKPIEKTLNFLWGCFPL